MASGRGRGKPEALVAIEIEGDAKNQSKMQTRMLRKFLTVQQIIF